MLRRAVVSLAVLALTSFTFAQSAPVTAPRLPDLPITADPAQWGDAGLRYEVLTEAVPARRPYADHDARAWFGWNDHGLITLVEVFDHSSVESPSQKTLWDGDSVELFLLPTARDAAGFLQLIVTPGEDPDGLAVRSAVVDHRQGDLKGKPVAPKVAARRTDTGYIVETLVPWDALGGRGDEVRLQLHVNDRDAGRQGVTALLLHPTKFGRKPANTVTLKLADKPSEPVLMAASAGVERWRRLRVNVAVAPGVQAKQAVVSGMASGTAALATQDGQRLRTAGFEFPLTPGAAVDPLKVGVDTQLIRTITLPDPSRARAQAIAELQVVASPSVFDRHVFPPIDFESPAAAEDLIGQYTLTTHFYDAAYTQVTTPSQPGRYGAIVTITSDHAPPITRFITLYRTPGKLITRSEAITPATALPPSYGVHPDVMKVRSRELAGYTTRIMRLAARKGDELAVMLAGLSEIEPGEDPVARTGPLARNQQWWYQLQVQTQTLQPYQYVASMPTGYDADNARRWPLILFLHGSGERGIDLKLVGVNGPSRYYNGTREQPFIIVSPQCPLGQWWDPVRLRHLLDEVMSKYRVDPDRVYLTGLSMGGFGSWELATRYPELFAALAPVCGGGDEHDVARIKDLPTWVFHGARDDVVLPDESYRMVDALRQAGGRVRFTLYPDADHNSWTATYNNPKLYEWMLQQVRNAPAEPPATAPGTQPSH